MRNMSKLKCQWKGCKNPKVGRKYCLECAPKSQKENEKKSHAKLVERRKKEAEAEAKRMEQAEKAKPKTKPCSRCKEVEIPIGKQIYCYTCKVIVLKESKAAYVQRQLEKQLTRKKRPAIFKELGDETPISAETANWSAFSGTNSSEDKKVLARVKAELDQEIAHSKRCGYGNGTPKVFSKAEIAAYQQQLQGAA